MKHRNKRISSGEYENRGWAISYLYSEGFSQWCWYINSTDYDKQGRSYFDPTHTLNQAKLDIDGAIAAGDVVAA